jgi:hypothetical protein
VVQVEEEEVTGCCPLEDLSRRLHALPPLPLSRTLCSVLLFIMQRCSCADLHETNHGCTFPLPLVVGASACPYHHLVDVRPVFFLPLLWISEREAYTTLPM